MPDRTFIHGSIIHSLLEGCKRKGVKKNIVLKRIGVEPLEFEGPNSRFPVAKIGQLIAEINRELQDEAMGFLDRPTHPGGLYLWLQAIVTSSTLREALDRTITYWSLLHDDLMTTLTIAGDEVRVGTINSSNDDIDRSSFFTWEVFYLMRVSSWLIGKPLLLDAVYFTFGEPVDLDDYTDIFPTRLYFSQKEDSFVFNRRFLNMSVVKTPEDAKEFVRTLPYMMSEYRTVTGQIRRMLQESENISNVSMASIANNLGKSRDTIRRYLKNEGSSFGEKTKRAFEKISRYTI